MEGCSAPLICNSSSLLRSSSIFLLTKNQHSHNWLILKWYLKKFKSTRYSKLHTHEHTTKFKRNVYVFYNFSLVEKFLLVCLLVTLLLSCSPPPTLKFQLPEPVFVSRRLFNHIYSLQWHETYKHVKKKKWEFSQPSISWNELYE